MDATATRAEHWLADRETFQRACAELSDAKVRLFGRYWLHLDRKDTQITPHLIRDGYWESWVSLAIARYLDSLTGKGPIACVDVGANVGYFTLLMADRKPYRVLAIEPNPEVASLLRDTVADNRLTNLVSVFEGAVSNYVGSSDLLLYGDLRGGSSLHPAKGYETTGSVKVKVSTLDSLLAFWPKVDLIKADVEGEEEAVWDGMREILARSPEIVVCMEVTDTRRYDLGAFLRRIKSDGFQLRIVDYDGETLVCTARQVLARAGDYPVLWLQR